MIGKDGKGENDFVLGRSYYSGSHLAPRQLESMKFGCTLCRFEDELVSLEELMKTGSTPAMPPGRFVRFPCPRKDHDLLVIPHFPIEPYKAISPDAHSRPMGLWGSTHSGKTVYTAILHREVEENLFALTGLPGGWREFGDGEYASDVVAPLYNDGILPKRTFEHEIHKISLEIREPGWVRRLLSITDMSGEWYDFNDENKKSKDEYDRYVHALHSQDSIYISSADESASLSAGVRRDMSKLTSLVLETSGLQSHFQSTARSEADVQNVADAVESLLRNKANQLDTVPGRDKLAARIARVIDQDRLAPEISKSLKNYWPLCRPGNNLAGQLQVIANYLSVNGYPANDAGQLLHRMAVTVSKADMLPGIWEELDYNTSLARNGVRTDRKNSVQTLRAALRACSNEARRVLLAHNEGQFVKFAEQNFAEVGYFFVSALGRPTEPHVELGLSRVPQRRADEKVQKGLLDQDNTEGGPSTPRRFDDDISVWKIDPRVKPDPVNGSVAPDPQYVLLPLLWLLTSPPLR